MSELNFSVDEPGTENTFDPVPPGEYVLAIVNSGRKTTAAGTGEYLSVEMEIVEGPHKGRKIFNNFNFWNPNEKAVQIAKSQFNSLAKACGVPKGSPIRDSSELHNIPFRAQVDVDTKNVGDFGPRNKIKKYLFEENSGGTATQVASVAAAAKTATKAPWAK